MAIASAEKGKETQIMIYPVPLVPSDFKVPVWLEADGFRLRMLTIKDVDKDYEAVMACAPGLRGLFGEESKWPAPDLTVEQNLIDLGWHQKEFQRKTSFA